jgi:hypothetical protein
MPAASIVSFQLARFDRLRAPGALNPGDHPGVRFCQLGAGRTVERGHGTVPNEGNGELSGADDGGAPV